MCDDFLSASDKSVKSAVISGSGRADDIPDVSASTTADAVSTGRPPLTTTVTRYSPHHAPSYLLTSAFTGSAFRPPSVFLYYIPVKLC